MTDLNTTTAPVAPVVLPVTLPPATEGKAPATKAPLVGKGATLTGIANPKQPVTATMVHAFINKAAGGNPANVSIVFIGSKAGANPIPFANMVKEGKRSAILWAMVNGVPVKGSKPVSTLSAFFAHSLANGASRANPLDLLAALNGGYSPSSKNWGTPYIKLVVTA